MINKKRITTFLAAGSIALLLFLFVLPADAQNEKNTEYRNDRNVASEIQFSVQSGFYDDGFFLEIDAPTSNIYYSLDGSDPNLEAIPYNQPIYISDATANENVYSARRDLSTAYTENGIKVMRPNDPKYQIPNDPVDKCTVVRAVYYTANGEKSSPVTGVYFVGYGNRTGYDGVDIICITTDPENLFGYENGIYVTGKEFDTFVAAGYLDADSNYKFKTSWLMWDANYILRGRTSERIATMQLLDKDGGNFTQEVGIRIHGGVTRAYPGKSLNIYARKEYGENTNINYSFWPTGYIPDKVTLTSGGNDEYSKIRDRLACELSSSEKLEFAVMHYKPYALFLNGEYWGLYSMTEKYDEQYLSYYYHVNKDNVAMIKHGELEFGSEEDLKVFDQMISFLETADLSNERNYQKVWDLLDRQSTIDYFAAELYFGRCGDWLAGERYPYNTALWHTRNTGEGEYEDGKWRWMLFDQNAGCLNAGLIGFDTIKNARDISPLFDNLCTNEDFRTALSARIIEIGRGAFSAENVDRVITEYLEELEDATLLNLKRFFGEESSPLFYTEIASIQGFFDHRFEEMLSYIKENFPDVDISVLMR